MAIAKTVQGVEPDGANWLDILDDDGLIHHYTREGVVPDGQQVHVTMQFDGRVVLTRTEDGKPLLSQEEPGLPASILVHYMEIQPRAHFPVVSAWESTQKYVLTKTESVQS
jgi:hypothetical protein